MSVEWATGFDFDAAVAAPFRMQPGLRRLASGATQLTPLPPGSRHQREKLAVLSAFWSQALCMQAGFDAQPALQALCAHAAREQPQAWTWDGERAHAQALSAAVHTDGRIEELAPLIFSLGDEVARCLHGLPPEWRLAGLLSLAFAEDFALVDARSGCVPWMAVALPSHWAPEHKVGRHFTEIHAPVADSQLILKAAAGLMQLVTGLDSWERFVWNVTDQPRLHAHPDRAGGPRWQQTHIAQAWWRTERQTFIPLPEPQQAIFTIAVQVQRLDDVLNSAQRAVALHDAVATMSTSVLAYRGLSTVRDALLVWLSDKARQLPAA